MNQGKKILLIKLFLFVLVSYFSANLIYYFPDVPPTLRLIIKKGAITLTKKENGKIDRRFLKWFDRDPERKIPTDPNLMVSPADGIVQHIDAIDNKQYVVIEMRYTDVHVQRVPMAGDVIAIEGEGKKIPEGASIRNYMTDKMLPYQKRTIFQTEIGQIAVRQITSFFASRIQVFVKVGEKVTRGQRLGRVTAGSTVVLELPMNIRVLVSKNQEVIAGETVVAKY
jgi:phosphatidylserine decarboxylase